MPTYTQANRPLAITTPLGEDALLLTGIRAREAISQLFNFQVDLLAELETPIRFDGILGQNATLELRLPGEEKRYFNGIVKSLSQGSRDDTFVHFRAEIVPKLWLLTRKVRSRIFQHLPVPDILHEVLSGLDVAYKISGTYFPRDYCVQYRESDFAFLSRLMEEEGIYYFFTHSDGSHQMVVTDVPNRHPSVAGQSRVTYDEVQGGARKDMRIMAWEKTQELRSGAYTLWDHCFELPGKNLEAKERTTGTVKAGKASHKLDVAGNDELEIYDYPGGYAQRFDGVNSGGGPRPEDLKDIPKDSERTVRIRMEQEEVESLRVEGASSCAQFVAGHTFTLERHFDADDDYLLTVVEHAARLKGSYRSEKSASNFQYENRFTCIPVSLPYRPQRVTRKPVIAGIQTATIVGPPGQEIFCDKYGRVKVQFHWDREGKKNNESSCWLRVAQIWAGKRWGAFFWPRIGHEVVVAFEDGDPDTPMIVGSVYNAENMPPVALPAGNMFAGVKSVSVHGRANQNFNSLVFVDQKGQEHLALHSERHMVLVAEFDVAAQEGRHHFQRVPGAHMVTVGSLPGTGGSGGGNPPGGGSSSSSGSSSSTVKTPAGTTVSGTPMAAPQPRSVLGLSSTVVYGSAFASSWPISFQLATNSLLKIIVDPAGFMRVFPELEGGMPPTLAAFLGGGTTGNAQVTLGNAITVTLGRVFDIHVGPELIKVHTHSKTGGQLLSPITALLLGLTAYVFQGAYVALAALDAGVCDGMRGLLIFAFQAVSQVLLWKLIALALYYQAMRNTADWAAHFSPHMTEDDARAVDQINRDFDNLAQALEAETLGFWPVVESLAVPALVQGIGEVELSATHGLKS